MSHLNYQKQCESQLETIKNMKVTRAAKIAMLESFSQILREKHESEKNKAKENLSTSFSENQSNFSTCERQIQELQEKILQKRAVKFEVNEEIEGTEDNLYQIEKVIETKRQYDDQLKKQINKKMNSISQQHKITVEKQKSYLNKSIGVVTDIFKGWAI